MQFRLGIKITERDFLEFNIFSATRSPYGKKHIKDLRFFTAACFAIISVMSLIGKNYTAIIAYIVGCALVQLIIKPGYKWLIKKNMESMIKSGKNLYSPESEIEFFDDGFSETTAENRTEYKYSAVERVSVVEGRMIYIHLNSVLAYIVPIASFESREQVGAFLEFIGEKCQTVDVYS